MEWLIRTFRKIQSFADRPWYLPFIAFLGGLDLFILVVPTDGLLISYVMLRPKQWIRAFILLALGCAIGSWLLAFLIQSGAQWFHYENLTHSVGRETWEWVDQLVDNHGAWALALLALMPLPQFPGIVVAALAEMSLGTIFFSVLLGRLVKFVVLSYGASHAPRLLLKVPLLKREISALTPGKLPPQEPLSAKE